MPNSLTIINKSNALPYYLTASGNASVADDSYTTTTNSCSLVGISSNVNSNLSNDIISIGLVFSCILPNTTNYVAGSYTKIGTTNWYGQLLGNNSISLNYNNNIGVSSSYATNASYTTGDKFTIYLNGYEAKYYINDTLVGTILYSVDIGNSNAPQYIHFNQPVNPTLLDSSTFTSVTFTDIQIFTAPSSVYGPEIVNSVDITATYKTMVGLTNVNNTTDETKFQTLEKRNNTFAAINTFDSTAIFNNNVNINNNLYMNGLSSNTKSNVLGYDIVTNKVSYQPVGAGPTGPTGAFGGLLSQNIIPSADKVYNLGSTGSMFNALYVDKLYVSPNTIYVGGVPISASNDGSIVLPTGSTIGGVNPGSIVIKGIKTNTNLLPTNAIIGDGYIIGTHMWVAIKNNWPDLTGWTDIGEIKGPMGDKGIQGDKGDTGATGSQGLQGIPGTNSGYTGMTGPMGPKGLNTGYTGPVGPAGPPGTIAGNNSFTGTSDFSGPCNYTDSSTYSNISSITMNGTLTVNNNASFNNNNTFSGSNTFSGTGVYSGPNIFNGNNIYSSTNTFNAGSILKMFGLLDFPSNYVALQNGLHIGDVYRTGGVIKVVINADTGLLTN